MSDQSPDFKTFMAERKARVETKKAWDKIDRILKSLEDKEGFNYRGRETDPTGTTSYLEFEIDGEYFGVYSLRHQGSRHG